MNKIYRIIATFFGAGYAPVMPGTVGTLASLPLYLVLRRLSLPGYLLASGLIIAIGTKASDVMETEWGHDPSRIVIDETAGLLITLVSRPSGIRQIVLGTLIFRILDILKPPPVGTLDKKVQGGIGVMADDIAAGAIGAGILYMIKRSGIIK
ncbi:MAG: phosphatidylglycerophosphatase A [Thermodesulfobacteriota bacterium]|nr:phosphatidylglycerophosphatase A [Thermodesulfobacteriota bacterium]